MQKLVNLCLPEYVINKICPRNVALEVFKFHPLTNVINFVINSLYLLQITRTKFEVNYKQKIFKINCIIYLLGHPT